MFLERYPRARLIYPRVLQCFGRPRGLTILPIPGPAADPPQTVHENSAVVCSLTPGIAFVVEWTGDTKELHYVHL